MELQASQVVAIADKIIRMESLGEGSKGGDLYGDSEVFFDAKNKSHYFYIEYDKSTKIAKVTIYINRAIQHVLSIRVIFLRIGGYEIASRLEVTENNIKTNYITLPHFITLKESFKKSLQTSIKKP